VDPVAQADGDGSTAAPRAESASGSVAGEESPDDSTVPKKEFDTIKNSGEVS
jgi:hypothetical protein